jgi:hypothetical protein
LARFAEFDLDLVAGVTDLGRCRDRNEDAMAIGRVDTATVAVVCDGVSSSPRSETAAVAAARAGVTDLLRTLGDARSVSADVAVSATGRAAIAAADAAAATGRACPADPPCCTYLSALLTGDLVTLGCSVTVRRSGSPRTGSGGSPSTTRWPAGSPPKGRCRTTPATPRRVPNRWIAGSVRTRAGPPRTW